MHIVATEACDPAPIHHALHEVIALHAIFVRRAVGKMREAGLAELMFFELPVILQVKPHMETHGPVVILALDRISERTPLRMALDAGVVRIDVIHARGILNIRARRPRHVFAARPVASFAADVPFRDAVIADIKIHRMAAVAGGAGGPLEIIGRVQGRPPVRAIGDEVGAPDMIRDVPLRWLRIVIVADLREVTLLPDAAVDKPHIVARELLHIIGVQIRNDRFGMLARIAHHIGHGRLLPPSINVGVTGLARPRAHITCR